MITSRKFKCISLQCCALLLALPAFLFFVGCARAINKNENSNSNAALNSTRAETPMQAPSPHEVTPDGPNGGQSSDTPDALVRQFYAWYLGELRDGKEPFKEEEKMKQYVTDAFMREERYTSPAKFDPALSLPNSDRGWHAMTVEAGKPEFYKGEMYKGKAYVDVKYKWSNCCRAADFNGLDEFVIGLQQTSQGWRIASIGIKD